MAGRMALLLPTALLLLAGTTEAAHRLLTATESQDVLLPCKANSSGKLPPTETVWWKEGESEHLVRLSLSMEAAGYVGGRLEVMGNPRPYLVIKNLTKEDSGEYHCFSDHVANGSFILNVSGNGSEELVIKTEKEIKEESDEEDDDDEGSSRLRFKTERKEGNIIRLSEAARERRNIPETLEYAVHNLHAGAYAYIPCGSPDSLNGTSHTEYRVQRIYNMDQNFNVTIETRPGRRPLGAALNKMVDLVIPAVTPTDAGVYNCSWGEGYDIVELEVTPLSAWRKIFGDSYWIVVAGTGGALAISALIYGLLLLTIKRIKARKKRRKSKSFFRIASSGTANTYVSSLSPQFAEHPKKSHAGDGDLYENMDLGTLANDPKKLRRQTAVSNDSFEVCSDDGDCYENTKGEVKISPEDNFSDGAGSYENPEGAVTEKVEDQLSTDATCYENPLGRAKTIKNDKASYDGECYENSRVLPITGQGKISGFLSPNPSCAAAIADVESEKSTGSQSYEDMEGTIYMAPVSNLLHTSDRSQEDDGDSYENMEGQALAVLPNQRSPRIDEEYEKMDQDLNSGEAATDGSRFQPEGGQISETRRPSVVQKIPSFRIEDDEDYDDGDFYLAFETRRPAAVQKIPSFKIEDHEIYDDMTTVQSQRGGAVL